MSTTHRPWSPRHRNEILRSWRELRMRLRATEDEDRRNRLLDAIANVREDYRRGLPQRAMARCPHSGELFTHSIDDVGLDGEWWHAESPTRRAERPPATFFALVGAVQLTGEIPHTEWLVKPGPEVPYVMPWILSHPSVMAVVSTLPIGGHTGYPITYFASPQPDDLTRANTWGANQYTVYGPAGENLGWDAEPSREPLYDYDLAPWIESEKLWWIEPGDDAFTLRTGATGCPYVGLDGERSPTRIQEGEVWR